MNKILVIPAYHPEPELIDIVKGLPRDAFSLILVINDGSSARSDSIFREITNLDTVKVLTHYKNRGKGAALKTGFEYILAHEKECQGVVTADADGQHSVKDILSVAGQLKQGDRKLVIGSRSFDTNVPLRSYIGNKITRLVMKFLFKVDLSDTQTGLRGIPFQLLEQLIEIPFDRYEFEIEMLLAARRNQYELAEVQVQTIYADGNASSSFNPLVDSAKIYFVLFRYILASLITAAVDYLVFFITYSFIAHIFVSTYFARFVALFVNFIILKRFVFHSRQKISVIGIKYILIVILSGFISAIAIDYFNSVWHMNIVASKVTAELLLYFGIFVVQKEFVFKKGRTGR